MKNNYIKAYNELKTLGCPMFIGGDNGEDTFRISGEDNFDAVWADYYCEYPSSCDDMGISLAVKRILESNGLFAEWITPGSVGVYEV